MTLQNNAVLRTPAVATILGTLLLSAGCTLTALAQTGSTPNLGPNVIVFDPSMPTSEIQATVDKIAAQQVSNQFGPQRYALFFKPGTYGTAAAPLNFQVGFYTEVAGLGASPDNVVINGSIDVYNQCDQNGCTALDNFWRSLSNLKINVTTPNRGCYTGEFWAVSQAAPLRRVHIANGNTTFMDYCTGPSYASGGFLANSKTDFIINGSQQQFFVRNSNLGGWSNAVWNQVFAGVQGGPAQTYPNPAYTVLATNPVSREKPFLYVDAAGNYNVFSPAPQTSSAGTNWATDASAGTSLPLDSFFIATPATEVKEINKALSKGQNLILTPGVYQLDREIKVKRADTVVLGLGLATLVPQNGTPAITIGNVDGVEVTGLIVDAGPVKSPVLFQVGKPDDSESGDHRGDGDSRHHEQGEPEDSQHYPVTLSDVYFRIGGATVGSATTSLEVNRDNTLIDDVWAWRADHGAGAAWTVNTADHGVVVNGNHVTATGLFVEHYQKQQVLWNGNGGETIFYQSELPYDPPSQSAWMDGAANGYPSYVVTAAATTHQAYGMGVYSFFNQGIDIVEDNAITVPTVSGVAIHDAGTIFLNGNGQITHVVNGVGATVSKANPDVLSPVVTYP